MPIDFTKPTTTGNYATGVLQPINEAFTALARWLDPATAGTVTSAPTGAYRLNAGELEKYDGTTWNDTPINGLHQDTTSSVVGNPTKFTTRTSSSSIAPAFQAMGTGGATSSLMGARFSADSGGAIVYLAKSRGAMGAHAAVVNADNLGTLSFGGSDGAKIMEAATVVALVDGTPAADSMPGALSFRTNSGSGAAPIARLSINSTGAVEPGVNNTQTLGSSSLKWLTAYATTFIGALTGNATTATTLATARTINGVSFNGSAPIVVQDATRLPLAGGTLTGLLTLSGAPTVSLHAATKAYADLKLALAGGTMTGGLVISGGRAYTAPVAVAFSATPTFDASAGNLFTLGQLTANVTSMTINNGVEGQMISIRMFQDAGGGNTVAVPASASVAGSGVSLGAGKVSYLNLTYNVPYARWEGAWLQVP